MGIRALVIAVVVALLGSTPAHASWSGAQPVDTGLTRSDNPLASRFGDIVRTATGETVAVADVIDTDAFGPNTHWIAQTFPAAGPAETPAALGDYDDYLAGEANGANGIATDGAGSVYVLFDRLDPDTNSLTDQVWLRRRPPGGTFGPKELVAVRDPAVFKSVVASDLAVNRAGEVAVLYVRDDQWRVQVAAAGQSFPTTEITLAPAGRALGAVALSATGEATAVVGSPDGERTMIVSPAGVVSSTAPTPGGVLCPDVAMTADGRAVATWHSGSDNCVTGSGMVQLREPGEPFGAALPLPGASVSAGRVAMSPARTAVLAYNAGTTSVVATAPPGRGFQTAVHGPGVVTALAPAAYGVLAGFARPKDLDGRAGSRAATAVVGDGGALSDLADVTPDCGDEFADLATSPAGAGTALVLRHGFDMSVVNEVPGAGIASCLPPLGRAAGAPVATVAAAGAVNVRGGPAGRVLALATVRHGKRRVARIRKRARTPFVLHLPHQVRRGTLTIDLSRAGQHWRTSRRLR